MPPKVSPTVRPSPLRRAVLCLRSERGSAACACACWHPSSITSADQVGVELVHRLKAPCSTQVLNGGLAATRSASMAGELLGGRLHGCAVLRECAEEGPRHSGGNVVHPRLGQLSLVVVGRRDEQTEARSG